MSLRRPNGLLLPFLGATAVLTGCSAQVSASAEAADAESAPAAAVVVVERVSGETPRNEVVAKFVRGRSGPLDDQAIQWAGLEPELPAVGSCARIGGETPSLPAGGVRLLDVGRVTVSDVALARRRVPDVVDVVSGVVYTGSQLDLPNRGSFEVKVIGEPELATLRVQADFDGEPGSLRVQGQDVAGASTVTLALDTPVELTWEAGAQRDPIFVDVVATDPATHKSAITRCAFGDTGHAVLPSSSIGDGEGALRVHRIHRSAFRAPGVDRGELRLDFAREVGFATRR